MKGQLKIQEILREKFLEYKQKNPSFSVRSFAKVLNMQPSAANEIMKGERKVSIKIARKIAERLLLDPKETAELLTLFDKNSNSSEVSVDQQGLQRSADIFEFATNWQYIGIYLILDQCQRGIDINSLKGEFGLSQVVLNKVINRLVKMNLASIDEEGRIRPTKNQIEVKNDIGQTAVRSMHLNDIELIKGKILSGSDRGLILENETFLLDKSNLKKAEEIIICAHEAIKNLESSSSKSQVFRVSTYLYSLTLNETR